MGLGSMSARVGGILAPYVVMLVSLSLIARQINRYV